MALQRVVRARTPSERTSWQRTLIWLSLCLWVCLLFILLSLSGHQQDLAAAAYRGDAGAVQLAEGGAGGGRPLGRPVWWHAPFLSGGGYSTEAVQFVLGLHRSGVVEPGRLWLTQHGDLVEEEVLRGMDERTQEELIRMLDLGFSGLAQLDRSAIVICHSVPGAWALPDPVWETSRCPPYPVKEAAYVIGRTMFETDSLPEDHVERCNQLHEIWVPTEFHKEVYRRSGVTRPQLAVIPEPVDSQGEFNPARHTPLPLPIGQLVFGREPQRGGGRGGGAAADFVFLSIFKWEERKGWDVLLGAYLREFKPEERVALLLLTNPFHNEEGDFAQEMRSWAAGHLAAAAGAGSSGRSGSGAAAGEGAAGMDFGALPRVYVVRDRLPQPSLPRLYKAAGAFVLPSRGEGWGRPHCEAMAMAVPVIATNWSGPTAFLDESVGYPLRIEGLVAAPESAGPFAGRRWAQPSVVHLRQLMRRVVERPGEAAQRGAAGRARMVGRYTPEAVARVVAARLREVEADLSWGART